MLERPELCRGSVEFVATQEYMVRPPMPHTLLFLIDVSLNAVTTGSTAAACSAVARAVADLPDVATTRMGVATFDSTIHFYNISPTLAQPQMLIVPDVKEPYTPLPAGLAVPLPAARQHLSSLLDSLPYMFQSNRVGDSAMGSAVKAAVLALKATGGKLLVFQAGQLTAGWQNGLQSVLACAAVVQGACSGKFGVIEERLLSQQETWELGELQRLAPEAPALSFTLSSLWMPRLG